MRKRCGLLATASFEQTHPTYTQPPHHLGPAASRSASSTRLRPQQSVRACAQQGARRKSADFGTNPCGEIVLKPYQFCNLSITVARPEDTFEELKEKIELATIIGTIQSAGTHFPGLRPQWKENCGTLAEKLSYCAEVFQEYLEGAVRMGNACQRRSRNLAQLK